MASFSYTYITSTSILEQGDHIFEEKLTSGLSVVLSLSKKEEFLALVNKMEPIYSVLPF